MRIALRVFLGLLVTAAAGSGGWWVWRLWQAQQRTAQQLQATQASLADSREALAMLEDERQKLADAYDTLKDRWNQSDAELAQLKEASAKTSRELATLKTDRTETKRQLDEARTKTHRLQAELGSLEQASAALEAQAADLEAQLKAATSASLTRAELEQLQATIVQRQIEAARLRQQFVELSRAYEQMAAQQQAAATPRTPRHAAALRPATPSPPSASAAARSAQRYRRLGEAYLAAYQYPQAAASFEESLKFKDDPSVHARLTFLYTRLLHDQEQANRHLALADAHRQDPAVTTLGTVAGAHGLPRKSWRLLWDWLTQ